MKLNQSCGLQGKCWQLDPAWTGGTGAATPVHTPVFDKHEVVVSDPAGMVTAFNLANGVKLWQTVSPGGPQFTISPPVLLQAANGGSAAPALVVRGDGDVRRLTPPASVGAPAVLSLVKVAGFASGTPTVPVLDPLVVEAQVGAHPPQSLQNAHPARIDAHARHGHAGTGHNRRYRQQKGR